MRNSKAEHGFFDLLKEQHHYKQNIMLMQWDVHVNMPKRGIEQRSETIGFISEKLHQLNTSEKMKYYIDMFKEDERDLIRQIALECESIYEKDRKIPPQLHKEYTELKSKSEAAWQESRNRSDFSLFLPFLEKMIEYNQQFTESWGYDDNRYDALLRNYEPGVTTKMLDSVFTDLRNALINLIEKIKGSSHAIDEAAIQMYFPKKDQEALSLALLDRIHFNRQAGRLDTSVHPYTFGLHKDDVRITTRYNEYDFRQAVFSALHEGGHGLYEQNFADTLNQTPLAEVSSMGFHESQALLWETFICGSKAFWEGNIDLFHAYAPKHFQQLTVEKLYESSHQVKPSFIRVDADEVTYPLHIMIRYEIEKGLINDSIQACDLPEVWNDMMNEYLGIRPPTDREGVLQDIHWSSGDFGYFPTYTLGMMYAAQFYNKLKAELNLEQLIRNRDLIHVKNWLTDHVYKHGKRKRPLDILTDSTGEKLNPDRLISYLSTKYCDIYRL